MPTLAGHGLLVSCFHPRPHRPCLTTSDRGYDSFMTQKPIHFAGLSDKPLTVPNAELYYRHFPARYLTQYLEEYVDEHICDGATLRSKIHLGMRVERVSKVDGVWVVHTVNGKRFTSSLMRSASRVSQVDPTFLAGRPFVACKSTTRTSDSLSSSIRQTSIISSSSEVPSRPRTLRTLQPKPGRRCCGSSANLAPDLHGSCLYMASVAWRVVRLTHCRSAS